MATKTCVILAISCLNWFFPVNAFGGHSCSNPRLPQHVIIDRVSVPHGADEKFSDGTVIGFTCDAGYTLFGSQNSTCSDGKWLKNTPHCFLEVAEGSKCYMSPQADEFVGAHLAADGDPSTCVSFTSNATNLVWAVDTFQNFRVRAVTVQSQYFLPNSTIEIRVGAHHPSTGSAFNKLCTRQKLGTLEDNRREFACDNGAVHGRYVSIALLEPGDHHVSLCEVNVYTDSGLSVEDGCPPTKNLIFPEKATFVFENQCIKFLGQYDHSEASLACTHHGGVLVKPIFRAFQNFLDFKMMRFFENSLDQDVLSFWVDGERFEKNGVWKDSNGTEIQGVQVRDKTEAKCLVSDVRNWHSESCTNQHQVICVSGPVSCGHPSYPEFSSTWLRSKLPTHSFLHFGCEAGFHTNIHSIECSGDGALSEEPSCEADSENYFNFYGKIQKFFRSFSMFAHLSATALNAIIGLLSGMFAALMFVFSTCCYCAMMRRKANKTSERIHRSFLSFPIHVIDLPINNSNRLFKTPTAEEKTQTNFELKSDTIVRY